MSKISILQGDITRLNVDAIVNAANESLLGGAGVDGAIHRAAGAGLLEECKAIGGCATGDACITRGYKLPASYVIHTVGPVWKGGQHGETDLLARCYTRSMELADTHNLREIAFPNISTGAYKFPKELAARTAWSAVTEFLAGHPEIKKVVFCCFDQENLAFYKVLARRRPIA